MQKPLLFKFYIRLQVASILCFCSTFEYVQWCGLTKLVYIDVQVSVLTDILKYGTCFINGYKIFNKMT